MLYQRFLILSILLILSIENTTSQSIKDFRQSKFKKNREYFNGVHFGIGASVSTFLNSKFQNRFSNSDINIKPGLVLETKYIFYPLIFNATLFGNNFKTSTNNNIKQGEEITIKHTGFEGGLNLAMFPFLSFVSPYLGIGYQYSVIGSGIHWLGIGNSDKKDILSVMDASGFVFKAGLGINITDIQIVLDYRKSLNPNLNFDQYAACLVINIK